MSCKGPGKFRVWREGFMVLVDRFSGSQVPEHLGGLCPVNGSGELIRTSLAAQDGTAFSWGFPFSERPKAQGNA